jgi:3-phosphoshikimate 1-carboxyvinyltransferase
MEAFGARTTKLWAKAHEVADATGFSKGSTYRATYLVSASGYSAADYEIEPDLMSASYLFAAAAITGGSILVRGTRRDSMQGDVAVLVALEEMGCTVEQQVDGIHVTGAALRGITFDVANLPDMAPTLAVVACFANGPTTITGTRTLRVKESDRAAALEAELTKLGARVTVADDEITIEPPAAVQPARIETYDDHRIAMAFSVAGLTVDGIEIADPACVAKTFPGFYDVLDVLRTG